MDKNWRKMPKYDILGDFQTLLFLKDLHGHLNKVQDHQDKIGKVMIMELGQGMEVDQVLPGDSKKTKLLDKLINHKVRNWISKKFLKLILFNTVQAMLEEQKGKALKC